MAITAAEAALNRLRHPFTRAQYDDFRALDDVSFEVPIGEAVGILGRNGAGKSTLLKILTRITAPTTGRIELSGRVGSLLEVGTGFHPELTGRENVFLNGTLLGMRKKEITRRFDEIVAFADVERFLETQVKRYSTGMYIRLAFAVAAHLESEILAVDEVLAVGDADFQAKCIAKMRTVAADGRTVLLVSHQVQTVRDLCTSAIYLERVSLIHTTDVEDAIGHYSESFKKTHREDIARRAGTGELRIESAAAEKDVYNPDEPVETPFHRAAERRLGRGRLLRLGPPDGRERRDGRAMRLSHARILARWFEARRDDPEASIALAQARPLLVRSFFAGPEFSTSGTSACSFDVVPVLPYPYATSMEGLEGGAVFADFEYEKW